MNVFLDIETIPGQSCFDEYLQEELENFKAPSNLTKAQACADLGLTGDKAKYTSKDDAIALWEKEFAKEKAPEVAEEKWRKTSFDGSKGEVISIAWAFGDEDIKSIARTKDGGEKELLEVFFNSLKEIDTPYFIGHYISGFDLKFLFHRSVVLGVNPECKLPFYGRQGNDFYCTMIAWAGYKDSISQDNLCKALGIEGKPSDIDGSKVWDFVKEGEIDKVREYNEDDVFKVRKIYKRLMFL